MSNGAALRARSLLVRAGLVVAATNTVHGAIYRATTGNLGPEGPTGAFFFDFPHGDYLVTADVPGTP